MRKVNASVMYILDRLCGSSNEKQQLTKFFLNGICKAKILTGIEYRTNCRLDDISGLGGVLEERRFANLRNLSSIIYH